MADLAYNRGTTYSFTINYFPPEGAPAGETLLFTVKSEIDNDITDLQNDIMLPKNIEMVDNSAVVTIEPADVGMQHDASNGYVWDAKVLDAAGKIIPLVSGKFKLNVTATNRITV